MNQSTARRLLEEGGTIIILNVPDGTEFGIDMKVWKTAEKFRGWKMIPVGLHFVYYNSVSKHGDVGHRNGFFCYVRKGEFIVKTWDKQNERISLDRIDENKVVGLKENFEALDSFLAPYPFEILEKWKSLTSNLTESLVEKLSPKSGIITSAMDLVPNKKMSFKQESNMPGARCSTSFGRSDNLDELLPELRADEETALRFTEFPKRKYPEGSSASEVTRYCLDSTYVLENMISKHSRPVELLGELEFCYICFLVGHSLDTFEQWKKIFDLLCSCVEGLEKYEELYNGLLSTLQVQLIEIPEEFLFDIVDSNNFIYVKLRNLFRNINSIIINDVISTKIMRLIEMLNKKYGWDFAHLESDEDDEAPVIVEI